MMKWETFISLLSKRISKALTKNEEAAFEEGINNNPEYSIIDKALTSFTTNSYTVADKDEKFASIHKQIELEGKVKSIASKKFNYMLVLKVAAIFLIIAGAGILWFFNKTNRAYGEQQTTIIKSDKETLYTTLEDSTQMILYKNSSITFDKNFGKEKRNISLTGEAYFDVHHNPVKPFIIETGKIFITVLGTAFNVKNIPGQNITVTVIRGKVKIANSEKTLGELGKNERIIFESSGRITLTKVNVDTMAWVPKNLEFDDLTLSEVIRQLEIKYSKHIIISNTNLANCRFSGSVSFTETLDDALKAICSFNNATYQYKEDSTILIDGTGCN